MRAILQAHYYTEHPPAAPLAVPTEQKKSMRLASPDSVRESVAASVPAGSIGGIAPELLECKRHSQLSESSMAS